MMAQTMPIFSEITCSSSQETKKLDFWSYRMYSLQSIISLLLLISDSLVRQGLTCSSGGGGLYQDAGLSQDAMMDLLIQKLVQSKIEGKLNNPQNARRRKNKGSSTENMMKMMAMMMAMQGGAGSMDMSALQSLMGASALQQPTAAAPKPAAQPKPAAANPAPRSAPSTPEDVIFDGPAPGQGDDVADGNLPPSTGTTKYKPHPTFTDKYGKKLPKPAWHP